MKACILKGDRVALDVEDAEEEVVHVSLSTAEPLESLKDFHLILGTFRFDSDYDYEYEISNYWAMRMRHDRDTVT